MSETYADWAWPGGYTILWVDSDNGDVFCGTHATELMADPDADHPSQPFVPQLHEEGPDEWCAGGSHPIASAYGDPDDPTQD